MQIQTKHEHLLSEPLDLSEFMNFTGSFPQTHGNPGNL